MHSKKITIRSVTAMNDLAGELSEELEAGDFLLLNGDLGAGKTTFVQGLARALGVTETVASPTYTVVGQYDTNHPKIKKLVHVDLYRLPLGTVEQDIAVTTVLEESHKDRITAIEWADRLKENVPGRTWQIDFKHGRDPKERVVSIKKAQYA